MLAHYTVVALNLIKEMYQTIVHRAFSASHDLQNMFPKSGQYIMGHMHNETRKMWKEASVPPFKTLSSICLERLGKTT